MRPSRASSTARASLLPLLCIVWTAAGCETDNEWKGGGSGEEGEREGGGEDGWEGGGGSGGGGGGAGECVSDSFWTRGNSESPLMQPGMACIECHRSSGEGPIYTVAGTIYTELDEPDDCNGVQSVTVQITDARGRTWSDDTNSAGNFFISDRSIEFPITAKVIDGGVVREMYSPMSTGDCGTCHTPSGRDGAPGRIMAP